MPPAHGAQPPPATLLQPADPMTFRVNGFIRNSGAAGMPAITAPNVFRVPAVLTADLSGITDGNGIEDIADSATYNWQRFASGGITLEADVIGTDATYALTAADVGKTLKVQVSFTDGDGYSEGPLTSAATQAITAVATDCNPPTYVGGATQLGPARKVTVGMGSIAGTVLHGFKASPGYGSLDDTTFTTAASNTYEIRSATAGAHQLLFALDTLLAAADKNTLVLHVCDQAYTFGAFTTVTPNYTFSNPSQDWSTYAERTVYISQDTTAPTAESVAVNGTEIVITFSEDLGEAASLLSSTFTGKKTPIGGSETALTFTSDAPEIEGNTLTLTLASASSVMATDGDVKVTYIKPMSGSANKLVDKFGNETASFADAEAEACPDPAPTPTVVDVTAVPIVVESTTDDYFVLYVSHDVDGTEVEIPVLVKRGLAGTTTLAENVEALPKERYRVEKYLISDPADVDGDCIDDITELDDFGSMNPANPAGSVDLNDGAVAIPDRATFDTFRFDSGANSYLLFVLLGLNTGNPRVYFMNSNTQQSHNYFLKTLYALGIEENAAHNFVNGTITYHPDIRSANGGLGVYTIWTPAIKHFSSVDLVYTAVAASMPLLEDNLALYVRKQGLRIIQPYLPVYRESRIQLVFERDVYSNISFLALNPGGGVRPVAGPGAGRPSPPPQRRDLRCAAQRVAPRCRYHHHRTPNPALARQPARRPGRNPQCLHPRHPRRPCPRAPDRQLRPV